MKPFITLRPEIMAMLRRMDQEELFVWARDTGARLVEGQSDEYYRETVIAAGHKVRLACEGFTETERAESKAWLIEHGFRETIRGLTA